MFKYHIIIILTVIIWGTSFISTKILINNSLLPIEIFLYRFSLAYVCIWFLSPRIFFANSWKDELLFVLLGLFGGSMYFITENTALGITLTSNVSLILCTTPVITTFLSFLFYKKDKLTQNLIMGSVIALAGVTLVIFNGSFVLKINPLGDFLTVAAALSWALYSLLLKRLENHYPTPFITRKVFFYGILTLVPMLFIHPVKFDVQPLSRPAVIFNLLFLGLVASFLCFFSWNIVVKKIGMVRAANYLYLVPLVTLITSRIVLNEHITIIALAGSIFIIFGVYVAERGIKIKFSKLHSPKAETRIKR